MPTIITPLLFIGEIDLNEKSEEEANNSNTAAVVSDCSANKDNRQCETGFNEDSAQDSEVVEGNGGEGNICNNGMEEGATAFLKCCIN